LLFERQQSWTELFQQFLRSPQRMVPAQFRIGLRQAYQSDVPRVPRCGCPLQTKPDSTTQFKIEQFVGYKTMKTNDAASANSG
jgi:hypothetical protein